MLKEVKNFELFRFYMTQSIDNSINKIMSKNDDNSQKIISSIFSVFSSFLISLITEMFLKVGDIYKSVIMIFVFLISYCVILRVYNPIKQIITNKVYYLTIRKDKKNKDNVEACKKTKDDFDHVTCDNMLIVNEFIANFKKEPDFELKTFYYFESLYYLRKAAQKIEDVINKKDECINSGTICNGIDVYRIKNVFRILDRSLEFLKDNVNSIILDNSNKDEFDFNLKKLCDTFDMIRNSLL